MAASTIMLTDWLKIQKSSSPKTTYVMKLLPDRNVPYTYEIINLIKPK